MTESGLQRVVIEVGDLAKAGQFYREILGCVEADASDARLEFGLGSALIECRPTARVQQSDSGVLRYSLVSGQYQLIPDHCVSFKRTEWRAFTSRLKQRLPQRTVGASARASTMQLNSSSVRVIDPFGNVIEFKAVKDVPQGWRRLLTLPVVIVALAAIAVTAYIIVWDEKSVGSYGAQVSPVPARPCVPGWLCL